MRHVMLVQVFLIASMAAIGCNDGDRSPSDAGQDAGSDAGLDGGKAVSGWNWDERWKPPSYAQCPAPKNITKRNLHEKAAYYDWISEKIHLVPKSLRSYSLAHDVRLDADVPGDIVPDKDLPKVLEYHFDENHGLWSSLYVASQAFRYAVTRSPEALDTLRRAFTGTYNAMKITGVDGLFTREYRDSSIPGDECPALGPSYAKPVDRSGNTFVKLDENACTMYWDPAAKGGAGEMVHDEPMHCVDRKFANMCWQRNCSKDESSGHNFAAAIIYKIVDDPELKAMAAEVLGGFAKHLVEKAWWITDYDGTPTKYGSYFALSMDELPGFNAQLALAATRSGYVASGGEKLLSDAYYRCLLQKKGTFPCIKQPIEYDSPRDYQEYLAEGLGIDLSCKLENYDNVNMALLNYFILVSYESDPGLRNAYRLDFHNASMKNNNIGQNLWNEANPHFNFLIVSLLDAADKETFGVTIDAEKAGRMLNAGLCSLMEFPDVSTDWNGNGSRFPQDCVSSRHGSLTLDPVPIWERCSYKCFNWWGDPYERNDCTENLREAQRPSGYLLPYWAGRYFGFISEEM